MSNEQATALLLMVLALAILVSLVRDRLTEIRDELRKLNAKERP